VARTNRKIDSVRLWITRSGEVPVREQIVRQVILGIVSQDLVAGQKLPSVRALARRHNIHQNTASAAYRALCAQGWIELRRGSGLYVRGIPPTVEQAGLTAWLETMLIDARNRGFHPEQVLRGLQELIEPKRFRRIVLVEPDQAMAEILRHEMCEQVEAVVSVTTARETGEHLATGSLFVALPSRVSVARTSLPAGETLLALRIRSISGLLEAEFLPSHSTILAVASRSEEFRRTAIAVLVAVGVPPICLCEIDPADPGWRDRVCAAEIAIVDAVVARELDPDLRFRLFRIISDECLGQLREMTKPV
jgi:DNA-binding transcriptional regulator YhcF (GntR family)